MLLLLLLRIHHIVKCSIHLICLIILLLLTMYSVFVYIDLVLTVCINLNVIIYSVQFNNYINTVG